jgi:hypothetical protein
VLVAALALAGPVLAASPEPSPVGLGDPRAGQAAGFAGDPAFAVAVVALIAMIAVAATLAWVRATGGPGAAPGDAADEAGGR